MFQYTTNYLFTAPSGASGITTTPSGAAWANSQWAEVHPGTDFDWALAAVVLGERGAVADFEVDIGVVPVSGAISGCVAISTVKGMVRSLANYGDGVMLLAIPVDNMPAGRRVGVRMRKSGTSTSIWSWAIQFYKKPYNGNLQTTTKPLKAMPSATVGVTLNAAAVAWTYGTWVQLTASAAADLVVAGVGISSAFTNADFEIQIGKGGVGVETALFSIKGFMTQTVITPGYFPLPNPREGIVAGDRVVARFRKEGTNVTGPDVHICYYEKPL